ncbi:hypothetical protein HY468_01875 [Candidatus Roizmanbacteria bacterium]|nr:hypothetical protein [Candidatus Roizmanbacteria bacterium]
MLNQQDLIAIGKIIDLKLEEKLEQKLKPIKKKLTRLERLSNTIIRSFDREYIYLRKRVDRIEDHLHLSPLSSE